MSSSINIRFGTALTPIVQQANWLIWRGINVDKRTESISWNCPRINFDRITLSMPVSLRSIVNTFLCQDKRLAIAEVASSVYHVYITVL